LEVSLRGYRLHKISRKLDVVIVAVRYTKRNKQFKVGQGYVRRGSIWGDITLLNRHDLVQRLEGKQYIVTGAPAQIPGEFDVFDRVRLDQGDGGESIHVGEIPQDGDELGVPLF
jgi:hypothetical protein